MQPGRLDLTSFKGICWGVRPESQFPFEKLNTMMFQVEEQGGTTRVVVSGEITEETDFGPILEVDGGTVRVDLGGVSRINSCGVREWLNFVTALKATGRKLILERCAPVIVTQLNTIYNFTAGGTVRSVLGPYYCPE